MADDERAYGAGEDIPGTPAPFPFGLASIAPAALGAALFLFPSLTGIPKAYAWLCAIVVLVLGWIAVMRGDRIAPAIGLGLIAVAAIASVGGLSS